jgi:hypothetical protein
MTRAFVPVLLAGGFLAGCLLGGGSGGGQSPDPVTRTTGLFCFNASSANPPSPQQTFAENQPVTIQFRINDCLSSSCTEQENVSCSVDANLRVVAEASWVDTSGSGQGCTDDCLQPSATCTTAPLPAGTHVFVFGSQTFELAIPSTHAEPPCIDTEMR